MSKVTGGHLVVRALKAEGVNYIFTLSGGHVEPIFQACLDEKLRLIDVRHEQAAVFMAEGWARVTGQPGVAVVTAGPGVTNAITSLWTSFESLSPIIVFGGKGPLSQFEMGALQDFDSLSLVSSITKWSRAAYETKRIPEYVSMAYRQALTGRPGPVYLEFPQDVLEAEVEEEEAPPPTGYRTTAKVHGDPTLVKKAVDLLLDAKRPIVIAGSGVWWSQAGKELQEFIEMVKLPLILTRMGRGNVPEDHPLCFGPTRVGTRQADVVLVLGTRLDFALNFGRPPMFSADGKWIQVDIEPTEIGHNRPIDIGIIGDAQAVLKQMIEETRGRCQGRGELPWIKNCREYVTDRREQLEIDMNSNSVPIHPARLCKEIRDFLDSATIIVLDGGDIAHWAAAILKGYKPGYWIDMLNPAGSLGPGIPYAMAAKLARPDKQVFLLNGDGSFGLNSMEFDTMLRHKIPVVCVVGNDEAWGMIKHNQEALGDGRVIGTELGFTRFDRVVQGLGGYGEAVERPEDIRPALERAFASGLPACVNVRCASIAPSARRQARSK